MGIRHVYHINIQCNKVMVIAVLFSCSSNFALHLHEDYFTDKYDTWNIGSVQHNDWHHNKSRSSWTLFHGPVILPYILHVIWCMNIIIWDYESVWSNSWRKSKCRSLWPIFHGQWFYVTSWRQYGVLLSYFGIIWPIFYSPVVVSYISHYLIPKCHIYIQEAHGPRVPHLSDIPTADIQMLCNIFQILSLQLMKRSSFKHFLILKMNIYGMTVNEAWSFEQTLNHISTVGSMWNLVTIGLVVSYES